MVRRGLLICQRERVRGGGSSESAQLSRSSSSTNISLNNREQNMSDH